MKSIFKNSLLLRLGLAMTLITSLGFVSMVSSFFIAEETQGAAGAINSAGSLRMLSYKIVTKLSSSENPQQSNAEIVELINQFDQRIRALGHLNIIKEPVLNRVHSEILKKWQRTIRPAIQITINDSRPVQKQTFTEQPANNHIIYVDVVELFVSQIDRFVKLLEESLESKIQLLRLIQISSLLLTILVIAIIMYQVNSDVLIPLRELLMCARKAQQGDLSIRTRYKSGDELGLLGNAFNLMAEDLSKMYDDLEERVKEKTHELEQSNHSLELLYTMTRRFTESSSDTNYTKLLEDIETYIGLGPGSICLSNEDRDSAYQLASIRHPKTGVPDLCNPPNCERCMSLDRAQTLEIQRPGESSLRVKAYPITDQGRRFGSLLIEVGDKNIKSWQSRLLESVASHIGIALNSSQRTIQERRLALLEERGVIARELHDSLAQALTYLKIQVSRLKALQGTDKQAALAPAIIEELRGGLNSAYRELRELLTTFRLRIDDSGLGVALISTIEEYAKKHPIKIDLDNQVDSHYLNENQEIHILHLIREALSNIVKHAHADHAKVALYLDQYSNVHVTITDNGTGIPDAAEKLNHYGLTIMRERAETLNGRVDITNNPGGGTQVALVFTPANLQPHNEQSANAI
ncbi:MAG TPA: HAMP domain-containing protein [Ectothiorhodospiraceae bacterium]|nr:HAMP domain-containing protein [Ectothiorhodospiraceae bacterium]